ncbi:MAG: LysM domain-containing protein [Desulfosarcinaceae bacterium]|nr:LysM domain-containing protein [Desulfosarcinaceae bacterium]
MTAILLIIGSFAPARGEAAQEEQEGTLEYKNYVVRYDRGWDILCEPYKIQRNDWVLKIFRQKGEIAHKDFREFLGIFKRLNPHIKDVNRIRPGQMIDIPLRKVQPGGLPGQASGVVTIPFVSITEVVDLLNSQAQTYEIQRGDTISQLIAERFGAYGSISYAEGVKMLQALNPTIADVNKIYAGQQIYLPNPEVRQQPWYRSIFDADGNIVKEVPSAAPKQPAPVAPEDRPISTAARTEPPPAAPPTPTTNLAAMDAAARIVGATLQKKGTYYFPADNRPDVELDLSRYPLMELQNGRRLILNTEEKVMGFEPEILDALLQTAAIVDLPENPTTAQVLERVLASGGSATGTGEGLNVSIPGVELQITAKWIETVADSSDNTERHICITPIQTDAERTPEAIVRYLDQHNITLKEIQAGALDLAETEGKGEGLQRYPVEEFLTAGDQQAFISQFATSMGFTFSPNVTISFPYAGIQVKAMSNLLSTGKGSELLIDFGDLYGDAITSIKKTGLRIVQIEVGDPAADIVTKVLQGLNLAHRVNPHYLAANRAAQFNTSVTINGFECTTGSGQKAVIAKTSLPARIVSFLKGKGLKVIILGG